MQCIIRMIHYLLLYIAVYHPDAIYHTVHPMESYLFLFTALTDEAQKVSRGVDGSRVGKHFLAFIAAFHENKHNFLVLTQLSLYRKRKT